ncbi:putative nudC protein [Cantharellus anzutake]|uniref:putative nudC protein n=1 Tax=Cantharellus anzutake TaxID=1750568 RepID=UPI001905802C|nr:putative nudC protein [Cantharellus anzutake]KAF8337483.1 putative nudC protein [Cantharellus anzutake]
MSSSTDPVPTPESALDVSTKNYEDMSSEERAEYDRLERKREEEEQATLPYKWRQELGEVDVTLEVPKGTRAKDLDVKITKTTLKVGLKGEEPIIEGQLCKEIKVEDSTWTIEDQSRVLVHLEKVNNMTWWENVVKHHPKLDTKKFNRRTTRALVEKMMFDNQQKQLGKPTSDELKKQEALKKFQAQHPELDFSKVKIS